MNTMSMSVLLVEDDEVVRTSMCFALESSQIRVIEAGTVAEGLRRFHEGAVDVVVIDLHLPDGTGYDLARWLWQQRPQLPLVMISTDPEAAGAAPQRPVNGRSTMLAKPFSASALLDAISVVAADPPGPAHG
jgi:CheY-like chemotaxis protein